MAKKEKVEKVEETGDSQLKDTLKIIEGKYGKIHFDGSHIRDNPKKLIPATPALDISLGGGISEGGWTLISGKPKSGKSSLAIQIAANAQKYHNKHVYYLDVEQRFTEKNLSTVSHLQTTPDVFTLIQSSEEKILSAQDYMNIFCDICKNHKGCVVIVDSISVLCSDNELASEVAGQTRSDGPKMIASVCRRMAAVIPVNNITALGIIHLYANVSGYGAGFLEDSGNKIQYALNSKLRIKSSAPWEKTSGDDKRRIGSLVEWDIVESANGPPGGLVKTYLRFGMGYDFCYEVISLAIDLSIVVKGGAWFSYQPSEGEPIKVQGQERLYEYFKENEKELNLLYENIKNMVA